VAHWNLLQLATALVQLTDDPGPFQDALDRYGDVYNEGFAAMTNERLGWGPPRPGDDALVGELFALLTRTEVDQVLFHRELAGVPVDPGGALPDEALMAPLADAWYQPEELAAEVGDEVARWLRSWGRRVGEGGMGDGERRSRMDAVNPRFVLRNYLAQEAIDAAEQGDVSLVLELLDVLRHPYEEQPGRERFAARRPDWARHKVGCSMLSCSS